MGCHQRHAQVTGCQHHHHLLQTGKFRQQLGVAAERNSAIVDNPFVHRAGHQRRSMPDAHELDGRLDRINNIGRVSGLKTAGCNRLGEGRD